MPALPAVASRDSEESIEELAVQLATTPGHYAVIADHYVAKAADARAEADQHRSMRRALGAGTLRDKQGLQAHCDKLIAGYEALATEYDAIAERYRTGAK